MKGKSMKQASTLFLRGALVVLGLVITALGYPLIHALLSEDDVEFVVLICGLLLSVLPFYFAFFQAWKLLGYIDSNTAFSEFSVSVLKKIKYSAAAISCIYVLLLPVLFVIADKDDAPGLLLLGLAMVFAPTVVSVFAAVFARLLKSAIDIKSENDLTV